MRRPCARCGKYVLPNNKRTRVGIANGELMNARGLCTTCYSNEEYHGRLQNWERTTRSRDELLDDYVILRQQGYTWRNCARKLDMEYPAFERAMLRARAAGDDRARRLNERELETTK